MTKVSITVIMEELVIIITVIKLIYRQDSMERKKKDKASKQIYLT